MLSSTESKTRRTGGNRSGIRGGVPVGRWVQIAMREVVKEAIKDAVVEGIEEADRRQRDSKRAMRGRERGRRSVSGDRGRSSAKAGKLLRATLLLGLALVAFEKRKRLESSARGACERVQGMSGGAGNGTSGRLTDEEQEERSEFVESEAGTVEGGAETVGVEGRNEAGSEGSDTEPESGEREATE